MLEPLTVEAMVEDWRKSIELLKRIDRSGITTTQREFEAWLATIDELRAEAERLRAAILDIDAHASPLGSDDEGFVTGGYIISVGCLHRALGVVGATAPRCSPERLCDECAKSAGTEAQK